MRKMIPLRRLIEEAERRGEDPDGLYIDEDDVIELEIDDDGIEEDEG